MKGLCLFSRGLRLRWRMGSVAIAQRSVILECFKCVGLVLTTIVHRLVWPWYRCCDQMSTQRRSARPHGELECATGVSRSLVENHITAWCRRGPCWCAPAHVERSSVSIHVTGHEYTARMTEDRSLECWRSSMMAYIDIQKTPLWAFRLVRRD